MEKLVCSACGGNEFEKVDGKYKCSFCGTTNYFSKNDMPIKESVIDLNEDVQRLLRKCEEEPFNAKRYANRILDIDPTNTEVYKYL